MASDGRILLPLALLLGACERGAPAGGAAPALFERVPLELAALQCGREEVPTILEVNGGGVALFDGDEDGDLEILLVSPGPYPEPGVEGGRSNRLVRNDGNWRFADVTAGSAVDVPGFCNGVAVADVDGDGRRDVYLTRLGPNALLRNLGGLRWEEVPDAGGAAGDEWSTSALFVDLDRDGDQDLFVANYLAFDPADPPLHGKDGRSCLWKGTVVMCGPQGLPPQADRYYRNEDGVFVDATAAAGFDAPPAYGLGVVDLDVDEDGWPDLYVSNDSTPNHLYRNQGDGTVREVGMLSGVALSATGREQASMGIAAGDLDQDGDEDLFVTNFSGEPNALYLNLGQGRFRDVADPSGLGGPSRPLLGWGTAFLDADLDGDLDVVAANGHVYPQADAPGTDTSYAQPTVLWLQDPPGRFVRRPWCGDEPGVSRALAAGDLDDDGRLDLVVTRRSGPPAIYRGLGAGRPTLQVVLRGPPGDPDACGSLVRFTDAAGVRTFRIRVGAGYQAVCDGRPVFAWRGPGRLEVVLTGGRRLEREVAAPGRVILEGGAP